MNRTLRSAAIVGISVALVLTAPPRLPPRHLSQQSQPALSRHAVRRAELDARDAGREEGVAVLADVTRVAGEGEASEQVVGDERAGRVWVTGRELRGEALQEFGIESHRWIQTPDDCEVRRELAANLAARQRAVFVDDGDCSEADANAGRVAAGDGGALRDPVAD